MSLEAFGVAMADHDEEDQTHGQCPGEAQAQDKAVEEAAAASSALRRTRLTQLAVVVAVVVAAIAAVLIVTDGSGGSPPRPGSTQANATVRGIDTLLAGIPQSANVLGRPTAPVTLEWFGDLECPYCREFTLGALPTIIQKWVRTGNLKIEYHSMETATREPTVFRTQQVAALAAGEQDRMWYYIETFYHEQGNEDSDYVTERYLHGIASQVPGLRLALWTSDRSDPGLANEVAADRQAVKEEGFKSTPSFLIGRTGEDTVFKLVYSSLTDPKPFDGVIEKLLKA
jgi:protein-disulfide isomerase